jgi:hypothetical protein
VASPSRTAPPREEHRSHHRGAQGTRRWRSCKIEPESSSGSMTSMCRRSPRGSDASGTRSDDWGDRVRRVVSASQAVRRGGSDDSSMWVWRLLHPGQATDLTGSGGPVAGVACSGKAALASGAARSGDPDPEVRRPARVSQSTCRTRSGGARGGCREPERCFRRPDGERRHASDSCLPSYQSHPSHPSYLKAMSTSPAPARAATWPP